MGGYYPVIFLEPRVLMKPETAFAEQDHAQLDEVSCSDWLDANQLVASSFVLLERRDGWVYYDR